MKTSFNPAISRTFIGIHCQWKDDAGKVKASIDVRTDHGGLTVSYTTNGEDVAQRIGIATTPCSYGGGRPWFICPYCHKRRAQLYLARQVACRTCFRMTYPVVYLPGIEEANRARRGSEAIFCKTRTTATTAV